MFARLLALAIFAIGLPAHLQAQTAVVSPWVKAAGSQLRLILPSLPTAARPGDSLTGGIELQLDVGAKTYWRTPGDTGVPPTADFAGSSGIGDITLEFPAPFSFDDGAGGQAFGYKGTVIFPVRFKLLGTPGPGGQQIRLGVDFNYGVCVRNMCMPAQAIATLEAGQGLSEDAATDRLAKAVQALPQLSTIDDGAATGIASARVSRRGDDVELVVLAKIGPSTGKIDLFVEARDTYATVGQGVPNGGLVEIRLRSRHYPIASDAPKLTPAQLGPAKITLVTEEGAIEVAVDLDAVTAAN